MKNRLMNNLIVGVLIILAPINCFADPWVDKWIQQSTVSGPGSFESESRGYVYGGRFSARYNQEVDHLVSIQPPSFKKGCGGIDVFLGSISYLDFERLVEKFEAIISGALATYAFDIALNVLCTQCAKELQSLEAIMDRLNQLQLNDCKATKAVVGYLNQKTGQGDSAENSEAIADWMQSSGTADLYNDVTDNMDDEDVDTAMASEGMSKSDLVSGCPSELKNVFFTEGTVLQNIISEKGGNTNETKLMAGIVGDVAIDGDLNMSEIYPCDQNTPLTIDKVIYGELYTMEDDGTCKQVDSITIDSVTYTNLQDWAAKNIDSLITSILGKTALTEDQVSFLNKSTIPLYNLLNNEIVARSNSELTTEEREKIIDSLVSPVCTGYAHSMIRDLLNDIRNTLATIGSISANQGSDTSECATGLKNNALVILEDMRGRVDSRMSEYRTDYHSLLLADIALTLKAKEIQDLSDANKIKPQSTEGVSE